MMLGDHSEEGYDGGSERDSGTTTTVPSVDRRSRLGPPRFLLDWCCGRQVPPSCFFTRDLGRECL